MTSSSASLLLLTKEIAKFVLFVLLGNLAFIFGQEKTTERGLILFCFKSRQVAGFHLKQENLFILTKQLEKYSHKRISPTVIRIQLINFCLLANILGPSC